MILSEQELKEKAGYYRSRLFEKFVELSQGHPGSTFSIVDIVTTLYHGGYVDAAVDKVFISKGHATVAIYPILCDLGVVSKDNWDNWGTGVSIFRVFGNNSIPGVDVTSGSLGHGVGIATGFARASPRSKVYVIISEGELYEGSTWEALLLLNHLSLSNVTVIIDINNYIILGRTEECLNLNPLREKLVGYEFTLLELDGHSISDLKRAFDSKSNKPKIILARTTKGKGVSLMENAANWHYFNKMSQGEIEQCRSELKNVTA